jgi:hypothetical protein
MSGEPMPWMPVYLAEIDRLRLCLNLEQLGGMLVLLRRQWEVGGVATAWLAKHVPCWEQIVSEMPEEFEHGDGFLSYRRVADLRETQIERMIGKSSAAKKAALARWKAGAHADAMRPHSGADADAMRNDANRELEREEELDLESASASADASCSDAKTRKPRSRSKPADAIAWSRDGGWSGITDDDRRIWGEAYPAVDIDRELARATAWLVADPKRVKTQWRRFLVGWLSRCQDRGGSGGTVKATAGTEPMTWAERERREHEAHWAMLKRKMAEMTKEKTP